MKKILLITLCAIAFVTIAATTYTITQLTANTSPGNSTIIEVYDPAATPKSGKYLLTNLATVATLNTATNNSYTSAQAFANGLTNTVVLMATNNAKSYADATFVTGGTLTTATNNSYTSAQAFANSLTNTVVLMSTNSAKDYADTTFAPLASPALTGDPTAPTPPENDNDTSVATTAYVQTEIAGFGAGGTTNMMVSTITSATTLAPTFAIGGLSTTAASCRRVTFRLVLEHDVTTVSAPAGTLIDGDTMVWEVTQDAGGNHTIASDAWDAKYAFGSDITGITLTTTGSKTDFITFIYNSTADAWRCVGFVRGY